jgi:peptidoglycan-N-acetylglucosamine deacetylase
MGKRTNMPQAYLTIDDSPTPRTGELFDFLKERDLQAQFFCRGDFMEEHPQAIIKAIQQGHIIGNHLYSHQPASTLGYDKTIDEIEKTERLIERAYESANIPQPGKYLRFPYLDRGNGARTEQEFYDLIENIHSNGTKNLEVFHGELVLKLQEYLHKSGYSQPYHDITHPLYSISEIRDAADCFLTYTSLDWMLSPRHKGKHSSQTIKDLQHRMEEDPYLFQPDNVHIVLFHDDREGIIDETCALIDYMLERGISFRNYT